MSTMIPEPPTTDLPTTSADELFASSLQDRMPEWFRSPRAFAGLTLAAAVVYFFFSNLMPLWHTDVWGHLAYGRLIWTTKGIPATEPLMPLSAGMPFIDSAWLSQVIGYGVVSRFGVAGAKLLFAAPIAACCVLLMHRVYRRTGHGGFAAIACGAFLLIDWQQLIVVRPQLAGMVCFAILFSWLTARRWPKFAWAGVPVLFALWANLHGSFPVGLAVLAAFCIGRAIDVARKDGRLAIVVSDPDVRRYFVLTELALLGTLLNPYGARLYAEVLSFSNNPNLEALLDWEPLSLRMKQGQATAAAALLLVFLYRITPRRISAVEVLLLVGLGGAALWTSRMLTWWGPVAAYCLAIHGHAAWQRLGRGSTETAPEPNRSLWTVFALCAVFLSFSLTPFGAAVMRGRKIDESKGVSTQTPIGAAQYLQKNPPRGMIFNTHELGDFLAWRLPGARVFATSHVHLMPEEVWSHYLDVSRMSSGWSEILDNYGVNTVVLDAHLNRGLARSLQRHDDWRLGFDDTRTVVMVRRKPL